MILSLTTGPVKNGNQALVCGDVNLDGDLTMADVILLNKASLDLVDLAGSARLNADCDGSGDLDGNDVMVLLQFQVQIVPVLPHIAV